MCERLQTTTLSALAWSPLLVRGPILKKISQTGLKPAMVANRWLAVFIVTCALGLAVVLDLFQLHVLSVIPCLCSLPTKLSPKGLELGDFTFVRGIDILKFGKKSADFYSVSYFNFGGIGTLFAVLSPLGDGTGYQQTSISKKLHYQTVQCWT